MLNQIFESNGANETETPCGGPLPGRHSPAQQRGHGCHPAIDSLQGSKQGSDGMCLQE